MAVWAVITLNESVLLCSVPHWAVTFIWSVDVNFPDSNLKACPAQFWPSFLPRATLWQKGLTVYSSWARHRWKDWWNMLWHPKAPVTTWMQQLKPKASSVKDISWNTRGMLYQLNIITLMVTVSHFKSTGRNQGDHFSIDLHEHSTKLIFIYWHIYLYLYIYIYIYICLEVMIIAVTMVSYSLLLSGPQLATTGTK